MKKNSQEVQQQKQAMEQYIPHFFFVFVFVAFPFCFHGLIIVMAKLKDGITKLSIPEDQLKSAGIADLDFSVKVNGMKHLIVRMIVTLFTFP